MSNQNEKEKIKESNDGLRIYKKAIVSMDKNQYKADEKVI